MSSSRARIICAVALEAGVYFDVPPARRPESIARSPTWRSSTFDLDSDTAPLIGFAVTLKSLMHAVAANVSRNPVSFPFLLP